MTPHLQAAAEADILRQVEWYADQGLLPVGARFHAAVMAAIAALVAMPRAGAPQPTANPLLAGLRSWPVRGFREVRVYYLVQPDRLLVLRVLHARRDLARLLDDEIPE